MLQALDHCVVLGASGPASFRFSLTPIQTAKTEFSDTLPRHAGQEMPAVRACSSGNMRPDKLIQE